MMKPWLDKYFPAAQMTDARSIAVGHEELGRFIREVLVATGAREKDAAIVAEGLVWANLRGGDGHGVSRLPRYLKIIEHGEIDRNAEPKLSHDRAATFVLDCGHGFGPVAVMQAAALAVERAKKTGVCFGLVRETTHTGAIGRYAQWIAERDCAAIIIGAGTDADGLSRRPGRKPVDQSDRDRGAERQRSDRARYGDERGCQRQDPARRAPPASRCRKTPC